MRSVLDSMPQHVDRPALRDLPLDPRQNLASGRTIRAEVQHLSRLRLRLAEEGRELRQIHAVLAVVILGRTANPANAVGGRALADLPAAGRTEVAGGASERGADEPLQTSLAGVGRHASGSSTVASRLSAMTSSTSMSNSAARSDSSSWNSSGNRAAASRTSSLPVTTSATRR